MYGSITIGNFVFLHSHNHILIFQHTYQTSSQIWTPLQLRKGCAVGGAEIGQVSLELFKIFRFFGSITMAKIYFSAFNLNFWPMTSSLGRKIARDELYKYAQAALKLAR